MKIGACFSAPHKYKYKNYSIISRVFDLPPKSSVESKSIVWNGKPWILSRVILRNVILIIAFFALLWLELYLDFALEGFWGVPIVVWTGLLIFIVWVIIISDLFLIRASNTYTLRKESLEITTGLMTIRSFVIAPSGFASMEVIRTPVSRILKTGDIIIRTQDKSNGNRKMIMVKDAKEVADKIREVMSKPMVRLEK